VKLRAIGHASTLGFHLPLRFLRTVGQLQGTSAPGRRYRAPSIPTRWRGQVVVPRCDGGPATGDRFATPFDRVTPGIEIFAHRDQ